MTNNFSQELANLIKKRRSVRQFDGRQIPKKDMASIVEAGIWAPSACNNQELRFLILDEQNDVLEFVKFKSFFKKVPAIILVFCDMSLPLSKKMYQGDDSTRHLPYVDAGLAISNMILFAKSIGIDSCVVNLSNKHLKQENPKKFMDKQMEKLKRKINLYKIIERSMKFYLANTLKLSGDLKIVCGIAFGYAEKYPDVNVEFHGGKRIMREKVEHYLLNHGRDITRL